jgi:hypothetical protein
MLRQGVESSKATLLHAVDPAYAYRIGVRLSQPTVHAELEPMAAAPGTDLAVLNNREQVSA